MLAYVSVVSLILTLSYLHEYFYMLLKTPIPSQLFVLIKQSNSYSPYLISQVTSYYTIILYHTIVAGICALGG